jgi:hypothetical protein
VVRTFAGRISLLNGPGDAGCVTPASGAKDVCGVFYIDGQHPLHTGQPVDVALAVAHLGPTAFELLVIYGPDVEP